jgi:uncharacterized OsmC-like protein
VVIELRIRRSTPPTAGRARPPRGTLDRIDRAVEFLGPLGKEERARLQEIADKCAVHRTLTSEIETREVRR